MMYVVTKKCNKMTIDQTFQTEIYKYDRVRNEKPSSCVIFLVRFQGNLKLIALERERVNYLVSPDSLAPFFFFSRLARPLFDDCFTKYNFTTTI